MNTQQFTTAVIAMAFVVVLSNILVQFLVGNWLTWAAFTYPFAFLITDVTNRRLGKKAARKVVLYGFAVGVLCSVVASQAGVLFEFPLTTIRIAIGSGIAFLVAQLVDVFIFSRVSAIVWWKAPVASSVIGSFLDTTLFFSIAFSTSLLFIFPTTDVAWANELVPLLGFGPLMSLWISLAAADFMVKLTLVLIALIPFRGLTRTIS